MWNLVANVAYGERYRDVYPLIQQQIVKHEDKFFDLVANTDKVAAALYKAGEKDKAIAAITDFTVVSCEV